MLCSWASVYISHITQYMRFLNLSICKQNISSPTSPEYTRYKMSNIQVVVRCRERNDREANANSPIVVELPSDLYSISDPFVTINSNSHSISNFDNSKTYKVDQVYGTQADQDIIFKNVALPLFNDFLNGFNVTILAYGQTGTGKTYTMCGDYEDEMSTKAGIIPRVLRELFQTLEYDEKVDYMVKCSYIELYNEELKDLLNDDEKTKLRIFENKSKNTNSMLIQNLTEEFIFNFNDGFKILKKGIGKRKTASTKLNDFSSRSHTIFTINLYKKVNDELFKISKMNLVDLAGSENITRSGAINLRAKEAGSINQSLLTLGRVINCLSEKNINSNHIPYRESKLTRLLRDSVGGDTKTTLIATISPAKINVDETTSTLDYASKAKNIKNAPQKGHESSLILKKIIVKELSKDIAKLNEDLEATRNKNGIYLNETNYNTLINENESMKANLKESMAKIKGMSSKIEGLEDSKKEFDVQRSELLKSAKEKDDDIIKIMKEKKSLELIVNDKDMKMEELENKLFRLNERHRVARVHLTQTVHENIGDSVSSIEELVESIQSNTVTNKLDGINREMIEKLNDLKTKVLGSFENVKKSLCDSVDEFSSDIDSLKANLKNTNENINNQEATINQNLFDIKIANNKLSGYISEDHLNSTVMRSRIDKFIKSKLDSEIHNLNTRVANEMEKLLEKSKSGYENILKVSLKSFTEDIIEKERSQIFKAHSNWNDEVERLHGAVDTDVKNFGQLFNQFDESHSRGLNDMSNNISKLISNKVETEIGTVEDLINNGDVLEFNKILPKLKEIPTEITRNNRQITERLNHVQKGLNNIQKFNTEDLNSSPVVKFSSNAFENKRSPSRSPKLNSQAHSKSPLRNLSISNNSLRSHIPQLSKSKLDKENIDSPQKHKRRKLVQQMGNILNQ